MSDELYIKLRSLIVGMPEEDLNKLLDFVLMTKEKIKAIEQELTE